MVMMVTAKKVAVPEIMLKMVRRVKAVAAEEKRKLSRYMRGMTAQPYSININNTSTRWLSLTKASTAKAGNTTLEQKMPFNIRSSCWTNGVFTAATEEY